MSTYRPGEALYGNTGTLSGALIEEADRLMMLARDAALARKRGG